MDRLRAPLRRAGVGRGHRPGQPVGGKRRARGRSRGGHRGRGRAPRRPDRAAARRARGADALLPARAVARRGGRAARSAGRHGQVTPSSRPADAPPRRRVRRQGDHRDESDCARYCTPGLGWPTITEAARGGLALGPRLGYVLLLVVALAGAVALGSLWATEPALPLRHTRRLRRPARDPRPGWTVFAAWVLGTRRVLLGRDRVIAGRLAVTFSAFYTVGMAAAAAREPAARRHGWRRSPRPGDDWRPPPGSCARAVRPAWPRSTARRDALVRQLATCLTPAGARLGAASCNLPCAALVLWSWP